MSQNNGLVPLLTWRFLAKTTLGGIFTPPPPLPGQGIVTFPLSLRISEILPLLCSSTPHFPYPPLVCSLSKFHHVPLGIGRWPLGYEERTGWANCPCSYSKISNLCGHNPPASQTDRRTTCDRKTALCTKVHRAVTNVRIVFAT